MDSSNQAAQAPAAAVRPEPAPSERRPSHSDPLPDGSKNENPKGIGLWALLVEDYVTHERHLFEPGFQVIAVHRFGNARMGVRSKLLRAPLSLLYRFLYALVTSFWGIDLSYTVKLGRRVRIWHHGGTVLGCRAIGDDVHIRHNTTFGVLNRRELDKKPIIGNRVDIGAGACVVGAVTVADDAVIGPNSVVLYDVPAGAVMMGVPARQANLRPAAASTPAAPRPPNP